MKSLQLHQLSVLLLLLVARVISDGNCHAQEDAVVPIQNKLHERFTGIALDESSGRVFASLAEKPNILEFDPLTGEELRRFLISKDHRPHLIRGQRMVVKGERLVCLMASPLSLFIINLKSNDVEGEVLISEAGGQVRASADESGFDDDDVFAAIFCSTVENGLVYVLGEEEVYQVDVVKRLLRNRVHVSYFSSAGQVVMSRDGQHVLTGGRYRRQQHGSHESKLYSVYEDECRFVPIRWTDMPRGQIGASPTNQFFSVGPVLWPINNLNPLEEAPRRFVGSSVAIHPTLDLVICASEHSFRREARTVLQTRLTFRTFSRGETLHELSLPPKRTRQYRYDLETLQIDAQRDRVLYGDSGGAFLVSISDLDFQPKSRLALKAPSVVTVEAETRLELPLELTNPDLLSDCRFRVTEGPVGVKIENRVLKWRPTLSDVGSYLVKIEATLSASRDQMTTRVDVLRPSIHLGGIPTLMVLNASGTKALVATRGTAPHTDRIGVSYGTEFPIPEELLLVDLMNQSIVMRRSLKGINVRSALLTETAAYVGERGDHNRIISLNLNDLSDNESVLVDSELYSLRHFLHGRFAAVTLASVMVFDEETLNVVMSSSQSNWNIRPDGITFGPFILDADTGEPQMLRMTPGIDSASPPPLPALWGQRDNGVRDPFSTQFYDHGPSSFRDKQHSFTLYQYPADLITSVENTDNPFSPPWPAVTMEFRNLVDGQGIEPIALTQRRPIHPIGTATASNTIVTAINDRLYVIPLPHRELKEFPRPLQIRTYLKKFIANVGEPFELHFAAVGGQGNKRFQLIRNQTGLRLEHDSGTLIIDTRRLWEHFKDTSNWNKLGESIAQNQQAFQTLTGESTTDVPFAVEIGVRVFDEHNASSVLHGRILVLGPTREIMARQPPVSIHPFDLRNRFARQLLENRRKVIRRQMTPQSLNEKRNMRDVIEQLNPAKEPNRPARQLVAHRRLSGRQERVTHARFLFFGAFCLGLVVMFAITRVIRGLSAIRE